MTSPFASRNNSLGQQAVFSQLVHRKASIGNPFATGGGAASVFSTRDAFHATGMAAARQELTDRYPEIVSSNAQEHRRSLAASSQPFAFKQRNAHGHVMSMDAPRAEATPQEQHLRHWLNVQTRNSQRAEKRARNERSQATAVVTDSVETAITSRKFLKKRIGGFTGKQASASRGPVPDFSFESKATPAEISVQTFNRSPGFAMRSTENTKLPALRNTSIQMRINQICTDVRTPVMSTGRASVRPDMHPAEDAVVQDTVDSLADPQ